MKSIIEETGVEAIDTEDDGTVRSDYGPHLSLRFFFLIFSFLHFLKYMLVSGKNYCKGFVKSREVQSHY